MTWPHFCFQNTYLHAAYVYIIQLTKWLIIHIKSLLLLLLIRTKNSLSSQCCKRLFFPRISLRRICYELYDHRWFIMWERAHQTTKISFGSERASGQQLPPPPHKSITRVYQKTQAPNNIHKKKIHFKCRYCSFIHNKETDLVVILLFINTHIVIVIFVGDQ